MANKREAGTTRKFLEYAKPDKNGWTEVIHVEELNKHFKTTEFTTNNGGAWCRSDTPLLSKYNVERIKGVVTNEQGRKVSRIIALQLKGLKESDSNRAIRDDIREIIKLRKCVILQTASDIQVDHKARLETTPHVMKKETQGLDDFQALCRAANAAKRGHCQACKDTKIRFDATVLGYSVSQWTGGHKFNNSCVGCYWYDPVEFNAQVSKGFKVVPLRKETEGGA